MTNYVMSLASSPSLQSVVELSNSPYNHYTYSNYTKVVTYWQLSITNQDKFLMDFIPPPRELPNGVKFHAFTHDGTKLVKAHSPSLPERTFIKANNAVSNRLNLTAGYHVSALHYGGAEAWSPPMRLDILDGTEDKLLQAASQIKEILALSGFCTDEVMRIVRLDSFYGCAKLIGELYDVLNTILVVRLRSGIKVWTQYSGVQTGHGRSKEYGDKYYLNENTIERSHTNKETKKVTTTTQTSINELPFDEDVRFFATLGNNREVEIIIQRRNNLIIRGSRTNRMSQKPFDLIHVKVMDVKTGNVVFYRQMNIAITGKRRAELESRPAYEQYRERFDVEHFYRFANTKLLLGSFQTSNIEHLKSWTQLVILSSWLLFVASEEIDQVSCQEWQKYSSVNKQTQTITIQGVSTPEEAKAVEVVENVQSLIKIPSYQETETQAVNEDAIQPTADMVSPVNQCSSEGIETKKEAKPTRIRKTASQTQRSLGSILCTFEKKPFEPQKSKKGTGRKKGVKLPPKSEFKICKKAELLAQKKAKESQKTDST